MNEFERRIREAKERCVQLSVYVTSKDITHGRLSLIKAVLLFYGCPRLA